MNISEAKLRYGEAAIKFNEEYTGVYEIRVDMDLVFLNIEFEKLKTKETQSLHILNHLIPDFSVNDIYKIYKELIIKYFEEDGD